MCFVKGACIAGCGGLQLQAERSLYHAVGKAAEGTPQAAGAGARMGTVVKERLVLRQIV